MDGYEQAYFSYDGGTAALALALMRCRSVPQTAKPDASAIARLQQRIDELEANYRRIWNASG